MHSPLLSNMRVALAVCVAWSVLQLVACSSTATQQSSKHLKQVESWTLAVAALTPLTCFPVGFGGLTLSVTFGTAVIATIEAVLSIPASFEVLKA